MRLKQFMQEHYDDLKLSPSFYHQWEQAIHVELGQGIYQFMGDELNMARFHKVEQQVAEMIKLLFEKTDDMIVVVSSFPIDRGKIAYPNFFQRYVKDQKKKYELRIEEYMWQLDEDMLLIQQMELFCQVADLKLQWLLKTCMHEDFRSLKPQLKRRHSAYAPDVFLVNTRTKCIFHLYDDRGCEIMNVDEKLHQTLLNYLKKWEHQSKS
ncbi:DUF3885 domain-containing protein [Metasolibacillus meyeri]|uniref:DUF3885 domain-containing protein n=1 Tax=Metasolibacillus meyeri TaxID=1071052 RepID=A0AAW9NM65_9BACL|nr:DUF3885 domain-containing protein [Metasolibacillus meyeri]MEC1179944.1 DUF3885 domain-containing protein [Metasolibacillus meyeri]